MLVELTGDALKQPPYTNLDRRYKQAAAVTDDEEVLAQANA